MKSKGIRILDKEDRVVMPTLSDILELIDNGQDCYWSLLFLDGMPKRSDVKYVVDLRNQINPTNQSKPITWNELILLSSKFFQMYGVLLIACKDKECLIKYTTDLEMYEACDIVIEMIDCAFWEVFAKDHSLIERLARKFKDTELLEPDWNVK